MEDAADFEARPVVGLFFQLTCARYLSAPPVPKASGLSVSRRCVRWALQSVSFDSAMRARVARFVCRCCAAQLSNAARSAMSAVAEGRAVQSGCCDGASCEDDLAV